MLTTAPRYQRQADRRRQTLVCCWPSHSAFGVVAHFCQSMARHHAPVSSLPVRWRSKRSVKKSRVTVHDPCLLAAPQVHKAGLLVVRTPDNGGALAVTTAKHWLSLLGHSSPAPIVDELPPDQFLKTSGNRRELKISIKFSARKGEKVASILDFHKCPRCRAFIMTGQIID